MAGLLGKDVTVCFQVPGSWPSDPQLHVNRPLRLLFCSIPLRLSVTVSLLEGTMVAWVPPPPGNRLFYSFVAPPRLELSAKPEVCLLAGGLWGAFKTSIASPGLASVC